MYILTYDGRPNSVQAVVKLESWKLQCLLTFRQISQLLFELQFFEVRCVKRDTPSLKPQPDTDRQFATYQAWHDHVGVTSMEDGTHRSSIWPHGQLVWFSASISTNIRISQHKIVHESAQ
jgi:hypothetical protein